MKQTEHNEIDLLLRDLARREGARPIVAEHSAEHLDADELNAYAEQALPPAARARYTSHLAECKSCRKSVSELTSASGPRVSEPSLPQPSVGFRQRLGALFSPSVLRYAVPAVALSAFIAIALVVLKQRPETNFVAQNQPVPSRDAAIETPQYEPSEPAKSPASVERRAAESQAGSAKTTETQQKMGEKSDTANIPATTGSVFSSDKNTSPGKAADAVAQPSYAPEPAAPPPPKREPEDTVARTEVPARQKEADKREEIAREEDAARSRREDNRNQVAAPQAGAATTSTQSRDKLHKLEARSASGAKAQIKDDEANSRTVSGRRFRRQGGVWVDTAYQSSTATTTLTRGSEQFRALVADEPGIRAIASQLDGEVVVVWKGRAYRIR